MRSEQWRQVHDQDRRVVFVSLVHRDADLRPGLLILISGAAVLSGCPRLVGAEKQALQGIVRFESHRATQATPADVGTAATVSLIDPTTNRTIATTLTNPDLSFSLSIAGFDPQVKTYLLEAVKGLHSNLAGYDAARLRTLVRREVSGWRALTTGNADIGVSTTALCAITGLRSVYVPVNPDLLIGTLTMGNPDSFAEAGTGVAQSEFATVSGLVSHALTADRDPISSLLYDGTTYSLRTAFGASAPPFISSVSPNPASPGSAITLVGGNFQAPESDTLTLNGLAVQIVSASARSVVATVPAAATTGPLMLATSAGTASTTLTITPILEGIVLPTNTPSLTPTVPGTGISGSVFGRFRTGVIR